MTITSRDGLAFARELGIKRVVLPRELSIAEIRKATADSLLPSKSSCMVRCAWRNSGQCLTSESIGGRSANRGECAQACRLPYEVICDGKHVELDNLKYLLSPQDLAAYELLPELMAAGVAASRSKVGSNRPSTWRTSLGIIAPWLMRSPQASRTNCRQYRQRNAAFVFARVLNRLAQWG